MNSDEILTKYEGPHRGAAIATLRSLIEVCRDSERGYCCAAEHVNDAWLKQLFVDYADQRATFAADLERQLAAFGEEPVSHPSVAGWIHRKWLDVRSSLEPGSAIAMLIECERGENAARVQYERALTERLPPRVQELVLSQLLEIHEAHDRLDRMRGHALTVRFIS
jgi:uncharacterized protein (TIGR02284 family)